MIGQLEKTNSLIENWRLVRDLNDSYGPPSLHVLREESIARFRQKGFPTHKDEEFKYTSLRAVEETQWQPSYGATVTKPDWRKTLLGKVEAPLLVFVNGQYAPELSDVQGLPTDSLLLPLNEALEVDQDLVMRHLGQIATFKGKLGTTNDDRFVSLNSAYLGEGAFLYLPKNAVCEAPIHIVFLSRADHGPFAAFPRLLMVAEESSEAKVVELYQGLDGKYFNCPLTEIWVGENAKIEHDRVQLETGSAFNIGSIFAHQQRASVFTSNNVQYGAAIGRVDTNAFVNGEGCETWLNGVYLGDGEQLLDSHTRIDHAQPNCNSFEVYKGILDGNSRGVFNGKIFVYQDAQKTDAKQTNQALLLSKTATVDSKPQLEIFADDVKCTHGATVGQLSREMLFYLQARGIPEPEARAMLVYAFAAEALEKITVASIKDALENDLRERLEKGESSVKANGNGRD
jgi:Fe-S cluster assembly protein SufD